MNEGRDNSGSHTSTMNSKDDNDNGDTFSPKPVFTLPVSVLNFCKMDVVGVPLTTTDTIHEKNGEWSGKTGYQQILVGVPSALDASKVDVYDLLKPAPIFQGVAAPSTSSSNTSVVGLAGMSKGRGAVMAIRIFLTDSSKSSSLLSSPIPHGGRLNLLVGYEDGSLSLFQEEKVSYASDSQQSTMSLVWTFKGHREPVLSIALSSSREFAISCGSDNNLIRYTLANKTQGAPETLQCSLKSNGIAEVQIRDDDKILALAGWDGKIRIFSCKTLKPLAVLIHHRESLYSIALASVTKVLEDEAAAKAASSVASTIAQQTSIRGADLDSSSASSDSSEDDEEDQRRLHQYTRQHWLAAGGKENRISQWQIY
ncbi:ASTRA complex subunit [Actinomortierella wolfii]|nr:ASTRA complex subunit [Actinomortierella wolfii]